VIDLSDPDFWGMPWADREGAFRRLRRERPVAFFASRAVPGFESFERGSGHWAVTRHAEILEVSRNPHVFSSARGATTLFDLPESLLEFFGSFIHMDDPGHRRLRGLVARGFTPKAVGRLEPYVDRVVRDVLNGVIERGACDFVRDVAGPLPLRVMCDLFGVPESQRSLVFAATRTLLCAGDPEQLPPGASPAAQILEAGRELAALFQDLRRCLLRTGGDDLGSALVHAEVEGERLHESEFVSFMILLLTAGSETARNALCHGLQALCEHPEQRAAWTADLPGLAPTAVEEIVRWASPVLFMRRTTTRETELAGRKIAAGEKVLLYYGSANRDEAIFAAPYQFDVRRDPNPHLGFGAPGPHYCLGSHLARCEIASAFRELLVRTPDLHLTAPPVRLASHFIHGIKSMPCAFRPGRVLPRATPPGR